MSEHRTPGYDVLMISTHDSAVLRVLIGGTNRSSAEALARTAEMRHGTKKAYYVVVPEHAFVVGEVYRP